MTGPISNFCASPGMSTGCKLSVVTLPRMGKGAPAR